MSERTPPAFLRGRNIGEPERFHNCGRYDQCLDAAARRNAQFDCRGCRHFRPVRVGLDAHDLRGCVRLILEISGRARVEGARQLLNEVARAAV